MKYQIKGDSFPIVTCELLPGEKMITEGGSMIWMTRKLHLAQVFRVK